MKCLLCSQEPTNINEKKDQCNNFQDEIGIEL